MLKAVKILDQKNLMLNKLIEATRIHNSSLNKMQDIYLPISFHPFLKTVIIINQINCYLICSRSTFKMTVIFHEP